MAFLPSLSNKELQRYHRVVTRSVEVFTEKNHMQRVFQKLNVTSRAQAASKPMPLANNVQY